MKYLVMECHPGYAVLLSHRPELINVYRGRCDLVLSGHAHGGQIRIGTQGLYAPGQGPLPRYTRGIYDGKMYVVGVSEYKGEKIPHINLPPHFAYAPIKFKNKRERRVYDRLVYDVKKTLPLAAEIRTIIIETYEYLQTLPDEKAREKHIKRLEKGLKEQYTPKMRKLTLRQGKLLIKLVDRECSQNAYQLIK